MSTCTGCPDSSLFVFGYQQITPTSCSCQSCSSQATTSTSCIYYGGPNLNCSGIETCDDLDTILSKIDEKLCSVLGDYTSYDLSCLDDDIAISTEEEFVEKISSFVCTLRSDFDTFTGTTFSNYQESIVNQLDAITNPGITCTIAGVTPADNLVTVLEKYCSAFDDIDGSVDLSGVDWDQCFTVLTPPTTVSSGFDLLIDQICIVKATADAAGTVLPTFNNVGSCLASPGASDGLEDTISKIKTKLCTLPTFTPGSITWGCVTTPSDLQSAIQNITTKLTTVSQAEIVAVSSDFSLTAVDGSNPCLGKTLSFNSSIVDRKFALSGGDATPGEFLAKVTAGSGIAFDTITTPGTVIIKTSGTGVDEKVKSYGADPAGGYLLDKLEGDIDLATGLTISINIDIPNNKVQITPQIDVVALLNAQFDVLENNSTLRDRFCALVNSCPSPCAPPSNVTVIYSDTSTTTTSTTT